jgi:hypothetical protein
MRFYDGTPFEEYGTPKRTPFLEEKRAKNKKASQFSI